MKQPLIHGLLLIAFIAAVITLGYELFSLLVVFLSLLTLTTKTLMDWLIYDTNFWCILLMVVLILGALLIRERFRKN